MASAWSRIPVTEPRPTTPSAGGGPAGAGVVPPAGGAGAWAAVAIDDATSLGVTGGVPSSCTMCVLPWENSSTGAAAAVAAAPSITAAARTTATTQDLPPTTGAKTYSSRVTEVATRRSRERSG